MPKSTTSAGGAVTLAGHTGKMKLPRDKNSQLKKQPRPDIHWEERGNVLLWLRSPPAKPLQARDLGWDDQHLGEFWGAPIQAFPHHRAAHPTCSWAHLNKLHPASLPCWNTFGGHVPCFTLKVTVPESVMEQNRFI